LEDIFGETSLDLQYSSLVEIFSNIFSKRSSPQKSQLGQEFTPISIIEEIIMKSMELYDDKSDKRWLDAGCGAGFRCEGDADCWCEKVPIHRAQMIEIMELFTDCICPECMKKFEARE